MEYKRTKRGEVMRFSTARTTPSLVFNPMAVDPNYNKYNLLFLRIPAKILKNNNSTFKNSKIGTLIASMAYSTWNNRPSGEKVFTPLSYSVLQPNKIQKTKHYTIAHEKPFQ